MLTSMAVPGREDVLDPVRGYLLTARQRLGMGSLARNWICRLA